jgi:hypothetical protein
MQQLPFWTGEGITDGHVVVRRRHHDILTLIHYHVALGYQRRPTKRTSMTMDTP